jgi:hypothetical protein
MSNPVAATKTVAAAHPVRPAKYPESATVTLVATANPKRAASAKRFALYGAKAGDKTTIKAYLDGCLALQPDEPRYRWRADIAWDVKHGFVTVA